MKQTYSLASQTQFETVLSTQDPIILFFSGARCGVCHALLPKLLEAIKEDPITVVDIDISAYPQIAGQQCVFTVPTVVLLYKGKELLRESGFIDLHHVSHLLDLLRSS